MLYHYLARRSSAGTYLILRYERLRGALRSLEARPGHILIADARDLPLYSYHEQWRDIPRALDNPVEQLPALPGANPPDVEQLPEAFDSNWWNEYVS